MAASIRAGIAVLLLAATGRAQDAGITWEKDLASAQAAAANDHRPVIAYFTFET